MLGGERGEVLGQYRSAEACRGLVRSIERLADGLRTARFMEFCGGHTHAIMRHGLRGLLPPNIELLSGPGCPVCVTAQADVDRALAFARLEGVTVATFGDMVRVPGSGGSLQEARALGADVRVVYSPLDAVALARSLRSRQVVFLAVGFETTAPGVAAALLQARKEGLANFSVFSLLKATPPSMCAIAQAGEVRLDGVIGPGHVSTVIGAKAWEFLPRDYGIGCAVAGFEPTDILLGVLELLRMVRRREPAVANCYPRSVREGGNAIAQQLIAAAFQLVDVEWRGLGFIPASGLKLAPDLAEFDAEHRFALPKATGEQGAHTACRCGEVLRGVLEPPACPLFASACTPERPVGPCMVSSEGACAAYYELGAA
jgi:hydrogenase expression/formation protein HypD